MEIDTTKLSAVFVGVIGLAILPFGFIWAMNTLFLLNIEYTFFTWASVLIIQLYLQILIKASTLHISENKK
jgi:hypothetical protein